MTVKTHTGTVITRDGEKCVKLHQSATTWVVSGKEYYYKEAGRRGGIAGTRARLLLESVSPITITEMVKDGK